MAKNDKNEQVKSAEQKKRTKADRSQLDDFINFIRTQGVVGLAVGLVLGTAVSTVVNSLINNIVMPPLGFILGSANGLKGLTYSLGTTSDGKEAVLAYGAFLK